MILVHLDHLDHQDHLDQEDSKVAQDFLVRLVQLVVQDLQGR